MAEKSTREPQMEGKIPEELTLSGMRKRPAHPLNDPGWRLVLLVSAGCFLVWLFRILFGFSHTLSVWLVGLLATTVWIVAIRMLFLDSRLKKFWIVWLSVGFLLLIFFRTSEEIWIASCSFSVVFLFFRRYKPYRHLASRRRAALFLIGVVIFGLLTLGFLPSKVGEIEEKAQPLREGPTQLKDDSLVYYGPANLMGLGRNLALYSLASLRWFWFFSLFHLFFSLRLHFMKLRPKMAVGSFLIAVVPLLLVVIMGFLTLYSTLGESRAARAGEILQDWTDLATKDQSFQQSISGRFFRYEKDGNRIHLEGKEPPWFKEFLLSFQKVDSPFKAWAPTERVRYFWIGSEIWLIDLRDVEKSNISVAACLLDKTFLDRLARILHSDVRLSFSNPIDISITGDVSIKVVDSGDQAKKEIYGKYIPEKKDRSSETKSSSSLWHRPLYFGMTHMNVVSFQSGKFEEMKILLLLEASLSDIFNELLSGRNPLSQAVMIVLLTLAIMLFILESFALFFGVRITSGFMSAVRALHRGTRRIAEGDLETRIDIPNEDELGDLAASFNRMAAAVKRGREEALERARLESELAAARKIQERLLPDEMPEFSGFEIAGISLPSQQVGGDYFDFLDIGTGQLGIAIADVSGKGMPAALLMANLQASLHAQVIKPGNVAEMVSRINNQLVRSTDPNMFATFFYGILDRSQSSFTLANAGHNPPLLFRRGGKIEHLEAGGLVLGFLPDQKYLQQTVDIETGDIIVLYTDGITEAVGSSGEKLSENLFGEERLIEAVQHNSNKSAREIQSSILDAIAAHTANIPQSDDITLVVIKRGEHL